MNERIRELAVQSRQEFLKLPTGYKPEQVGMYPQLMEMFAELIINDFLSICEVEKEVYAKLRMSAFEFEEKSIYAEGETASDRIRIMAKRRFGVE